MKWLCLNNLPKIIISTPKSNQPTPPPFTSIILISCFQQSLFPHPHLHQGIKEIQSQMHISIHSSQISFFSTSAKWLIRHRSMCCWEFFHLFYIYFPRKNNFSLFFWQNCNRWAFGDENCEVIWTWQTKRIFTRSNAPREALTSRHLMDGVFHSFSCRFIRT